MQFCICQRRPYDVVGQNTAPATTLCFASSHNHDEPIRFQ